MSYEINEIVIIDANRNIVNAGVVTATRFAGDGSSLTSIDSDQLSFSGNTIEPGAVNINSSTEVSAVLDEDNMVSDSASALVTQQSVKAYVDSAITTVQSDVDQNESDSDNADSLLSGRLDVLEADPTTQTLLDNEASTRSAADVLLNTAVSNANLAIAANEDHIDNLATLSGVAKDAEDLGTFTGSTISDTSTIKAALQDLENGVDNALGGGAAATSVETVTTATDATHYLTFVNADNGTGTQENLFTDAGIQYNPSSDILSVGEVVISDNLTVNGTQTIFDTTVIQAQDKNITLGVTTSPTDAGADGGGLTLKGTTDKTFNWINATDAFTASEHISIAAGKEFRINGVKVVDSTSLGSLVVDSSLTSVGNLTDLTVTGDITANGNITGDNATDITGIRVMHSQFITIDNINLNSTATELNYLDGSTPGTATASNAVVLDGSLDIAGINNIDITGDLVGDGASNVSGVSSVTASGKMFAQAFTVSSDENLKENIEEIPNAVEKVEAIRGVTFDWKDGSGSTAGIIAQEVEAVMPMLIEGGDFKRVDYNGLVGLLVEAVKELSAEVKELKAKN